jgi:hypothetical protein
MCIPPSLLGNGSANTAATNAHATIETFLERRFVRGLFFDAGNV